MSGFKGDKFPSILGQGLPGSQPLRLLRSGTLQLNLAGGGLLGGGGGSKGSSGMVGGSARGEARIILRQAFGNSRRVWGSNGVGQGTSPLNTPNPLCGQFRAAYSAGDIITPLTGGGQAANQRYGFISNLVSGNGAAWNTVNHGGIHTGQATYVGNPKYVYDSSDFIKYKKIKALGKTYNDSSFGGDLTGQNQASALAKVR